VYARIYILCENIDRKRILRCALLPKFLVNSVIFLLWRDDREDQFSRLINHTAIITHKVRIIDKSLIGKKKKKKKKKIKKNKKKKKKKKKNFLIDAELKWTHLNKESKKYLFENIPNINQKHVDISQ